MKYDKLSATLDFFANGLHNMSYGQIMIRWGWNSKSSVHNFVQGLLDGTANEIETLNDLIKGYLKGIKERKKNGTENDSNPKKPEPLFPKEFERDNLVYPFDTIRFKGAWRAWIEYKWLEHKQKYVSEKSEQTSINRLFKDSGGNEAKAVDMIECSISHRWLGIYEDKTVRERYGTLKRREKEIMEEKNKDPKDTWSEPDNNSDIKDTWSHETPEKAIGDLPETV